MFIFTLHARWCDGGPWEALSQSCRFDPGIYSAASPRGAAGGKQQNKSIYCSLINKIAPSDTLSETRFCFVVGFFLLQLFDIERAQLYLSVLQQLEVVYASAPQHRRSVLQTCLPKLINHSLKLLQEPSQQVWRETLKLQTPGRNFINQIGSLIILALIVLCFSSDRLCGKPGGWSCCYGVSGDGMRSHGAEGDFHATTRDDDSPEISQRLLLHPTVIFLPKSGIFWKLEQTSGKTSNGRWCEVSASLLSFSRESN